MSFQTNNPHEDRAIEIVTHIMRNAGLNYMDMEADAAQLVAAISKYAVYEMQQSQKQDQAA